jgi:hypothetical protein
MKKFILAITVAAFTVGAFAGDACCATEKAKTASKGKAGCGEKVTVAKKTQSPKDAAANKS